MIRHILESFMVILFYIRKTDFIDEQTQYNISTLTFGLVDLN
jgi:hypothetical protein